VATLKRRPRPALAIAQIAKTNTHIVIHMSRHAEGNSYAKYGVRDCQRVEIAIAKENEAGQRTPHHREHCEYRIGQMRQGEQRCGRECRTLRFAQDPQ